MSSGWLSSLHATANYTRTAESILSLFVSYVITPLSLVLVQNVVETIIFVIKAAINVIILIGKPARATTEHREWIIYMIVTDNIYIV